MKKYKYTKSFTFEGKRYFVHANKKDELYLKMAEKKLILKKGLVVYDSTMLFSVWCRECIRTYKANVGERTRKEMQIRLNAHVLPVIGSLPIGKIRAVQCQNILNSLDGYSKSYISKVFQDMKFIFEKAKENKMIAENPAAYLSRPKGTVNHRRSITDSERRCLLDVAESDSCYLLFLLMLFCGCRPQEAIEAQIRDIERIQGSPFLHIRGTKTVNADRLVPIPPYLMARIPKRSPFEPIALNRHGSKHSLASYKRLVNHLRRDMNIAMGCRVYRNRLIPPYPLADDFVPYCLRHTYCTDLQKAGVDVRTAQKLMGHADISTTANIYTHQDDALLMEAAKKVGEIQLGCNTGCNT